MNFDWLKLGLELLRLWNRLTDAFKTERDREAGRKEVALDIKEKSDEAVKKADAADAAVREHIVAGGLRDDDGYRRD